MSDRQLKKISLPDEILLILDRFEEYGKRSYLIGGSVRDLILGKTISDYDIATPSTPAEIKEIFSDFTCINTGLKHGTVTLLIDKKPFQITTFRTDGKYSDHRRPNNVVLTTSLLEDSQRRDFTINQIAYNPVEGLVDYHGGLADIKSKLIRTVGDPYKRFNEDALRIIRALRFATQLDFKVEEQTLTAIQEMVHDLDFVASERITVELNGILNSKFLANAWPYLLILWDYLFPKYVYDILKSFDYEFLEAMPQNHFINLTLLSYFIRDDDLETFLSKLKLRRSESEYVTSYSTAIKELAKINSDEVPVNEDISNSTKFNSKKFNSVKLESTKSDMARLDTVQTQVNTTENSDDTDDLNGSDDSKLSPLYLIELRNKYNLNLQNLIEILRLTALNKVYGISQNLVAKAEASLEKILSKNIPLSTLDLVISGKDLINLGYTQGEIIGKILNAFLIRVARGELENTRESLLKAAQKARDLCSPDLP